MRTIKDVISVSVGVALLLTASIGCAARRMAPAPETASPSSTSSAPRPQPTPTPGDLSPVTTPSDSGNSSSATFPHELMPPVGGWIAFLTPTGHLTLTSPDGCRSVGLSQWGRVSCVRWSPDGRWLAVNAERHLVVVSIESSRSVPLATDAGDGCPLWSRDSRFLAYLQRTEPAGRKAPWPTELCLADLSSGRMMALGSYPQPGTPDEVAQLCGQSFPYPYVPVTRGVLGWGYLDVWDARTRDTTSIDGIVGCCAHLWDVGGAGIVYPKQELAAPSISLIRPFGMYGVSTPSSLWPVSLGIWRLEDRRSQVVLAAAEKQRYWPTLQLPDGRLEVHVEQWEKDSYQTIDAPPPEREAYRYLHLNVDGTFEEESEQDLPWWAGGRLEARLSQNQLPQPKGRLASWQVGPDGETVVFAWRWLEGEQFRQGVYLWRGEGEPVRLAMGYDPQWQPVQSRP